jgi:IS30 family transposase
MKAGQTQIEIARILGRHKSTISRELARGSGRREYRPRQAQNRSEERSKYSRNAARVSPEIWCSAEAFLGLPWSPEQVLCQGLFFGVERLDDQLLMHEQRHGEILSIQAMYARLDSKER